MVGDGYFSYTMALFWCTRIFLTIKTGAGSRVFARNHNLTDIADMISAWRATEQPPGGIGVRKTGMPCYETPSLWYRAQRRCLLHLPGIFLLTSTL